ncbi:MAG TPA: DUF4394 domain-containing protein [Alphaproteobacteria bacterium]|nr:DUF4394 domain-containing protein [Alphaproteobacteria bacterium]
MNRTIRPLFIAAAVSAGCAALPAAAGTLVGLVDGKSLALIDTDSKKVTKTVAISGAPALVGIDQRPADGMLYGLAADGTVFTVDVASGKATQKSKLSTMLPMGVTATVDFNPVADRLRVIGSDGTNLRANVDDGMVTTDGKLKFADSDMHKGETPKIVAGAYTNSVKGAKETALFDIDGTIGGLIKQAPPNDGVLNAVGKLGVAGSGPMAFDILPDGMGGNSGWLLAGGTLHQVDLASGKATAAGKIDGLPSNVIDIAAWSAM